MREVITVPFDKKKEAVSLGAYFDTSDRKWYITEDTEFDNHEALRHLADIEVPEITVDLPEEDQSLAGEEQIEAEETNTSVGNKEFFDWSGILNSRDSLQVAMTIRDHNLPESEEDRVKMLDILNVRTPGNYLFSYDGLCNLSQDFERVYSPERIQSLASKLTSPGDYLTRIRNSELSAEEKALMRLVLPLDAE